ncbi:MAG TPA: flavin reductase family protein, partial [Flavobacteriales bacterium]|nr:flavin reductase family protein [Flavobacteriales bacterium]
MRVITPGEVETTDLHQFILGTVAPRPIAFVSSIDENGIPNIAPYSFFNAFSSNPPVLVFSSNRRVADNTTKDTLHNAEINQEVVVNVVNYSIVRQMALASISYPSDINEFLKSGLTPLPSDLVKPFRIKESPAHFECKVSEIITLGKHGGAGHLIICNVLRMHVNEAVIDKNNRINPHKIDLVGRMGRSHYVRAQGDAIFDLYQSVMKPALGFDQLPEHILKSNIFTGNDIAQFAGLYEFPSGVSIEKLMTSDATIANILKSSKNPDEKMRVALHKEAKSALDDGDAIKAFQIAMVFES